MAQHFDKGDQVRVQTTFSDSDGTVSDPATVTFKFTIPAGTTTTYVYGTDAELVRLSEGIYYVDIDCATAGIYYWRMYSTGSAQAADEGFFSVEASRF
jgi:hypothetical protein